jgi:hypothetical protein
VAEQEASLYLTTIDVAQFVVKSLQLRQTLLPVLEVLLFRSAPLYFAHRSQSRQQLIESVLRISYMLCPKVSLNTKDAVAFLFGQFFRNKGFEGVHLRAGNDVAVGRAR